MKTTVKESAHPTAQTFVHIPPLVRNPLIPLENQSVVTKRTWIIGGGGNKCLNRLDRCLLPHIIVTTALLSINNVHLHVQ